jgi:hypothetical protein
MAELERRLPDIDAEPIHPFMASPRSNQRPILDAKKVVLRMVARSSQRAEACGCSQCFYEFRYLSRMKINEPT